MDRIDCVVIGAGAVGLAIARALSAQGREVLIAEREKQFGMGTSSRNSEVIHAGIYYPKGSLKARLCVEGRDRLYEYCASRGVGHRRCGKLIVAVNGTQLPQLDRIAEAAAANGVTDIVRLGGAEARAKEPELRAEGALFSPSTGIIDSHGYMLALLGDAEAQGAVIAYGTEVEAMDVAPDGIALTFAGDDAPSLKASLVVNAAGLDAPRVARAIRGFPAAHVPRAYFAKGSYFKLTGRAPFTHLVYPIPEPGGLGVHMTVDLAGQAKFGPDVEWVDAPNYTVDPARAGKFYDAIRTYWPGLKDGQLAPDYAGVRPKISAPGAPAADFHIDGPETHGVAGIVNLFGIESPGMTASLAIARHVTALANAGRRV